MMLDGGFLDAAGELARGEERGRGADGRRLWGGISPAIRAGLACYLEATAATGVWDLGRPIRASLGELASKLGLGESTLRRAQAQIDALVVYQDGGLVYRRRWRSVQRYALQRWVVEALAYRAPSSVLRVLEPVVRLLSVGEATGRQPVCQLDYLQDRAGCGRSTAVRALRWLRTNGLVADNRPSRRRRVYHEATGRMVCPARELLPKRSALTPVAVDLRAPLLVDTNCNHQNGTAVYPPAKPGPPAPQPDALRAPDEQRYSSPEGSAAARPAALRALGSDHRAPDADVGASRGSTGTGDGSNTAHDAPPATPDHPAEPRAAAPVAPPEWRRQDGMSAEGLATWARTADAAKAGLGRGDCHTWARERLATDCGSWPHFFALVAAERPALLAADDPWAWLAKVTRRRLDCGEISYPAGREGYRPSRTTLGILDDPERRAAVKVRADEAARVVAHAAARVEAAQAERGRDVVARRVLWQRSARAGQLADASRGVSTLGELGRLRGELAELSGGWAALVAAAGPAGAEIALAGEQSFGAARLALDAARDRISRSKSRVAPKQHVEVAQAQQAARVEVLDCWWREAVETAVGRGAVSAYDAQHWLSRVDARRIGARVLLGVADDAHAELLSGGDLGPVVDAIVATLGGDVEVEIHAR